MTKIQKWPQIRKWWNGLSAEGAKADVRSALHSADDPPFFVFLSFSCIYVCCGSMCSLGSMWAQQSYSAVLHLHLWWYYFNWLWQILNQKQIKIAIWWWDEQACLVKPPRVTMNNSSEGISSPILSAGRNMSGAWEALESGETRTSRDVS